MSGLLHRLARQALGVAQPIHSAARLPFAPPPRLAGGILPVDTTTRLASPLTQAETMIAGAPSPPDRPRRREASSGASEVRGAGSALPPTPDAEPQAASLGERQGTGSRGRLALTCVSLPLLGGRGRVSAPVPGVQSRDPDLGAPVSGADGAAARRASPPFVAPLLPPQHPRSAAFWAPTAQVAHGPESSAQVEETTEVHVTIGRIEVTAVHEAPAPKRPAAPVRQPMTLEEYLTRRQGGRG